LLTIIHKRTPKMLGEWGVTKRNIHSEKRLEREPTRTALYTPQIRQIRVANCKNGRGKRSIVGTKKNPEKEKKV